MWHPIVELMAATPPDPSSSANSDAHAAIIASIIGAGALIFTTVMTTGRSRRTTTAPAGPGLGAQVAELRGTIQEMKAATVEWRSEHGKAGNDWATWMESRQALAESRLSNLEERISNL